MNRFFAGLAGLSCLIGLSACSGDDAKEYSYNWLHQESGGTSEDPYINMSTQLRPSLRPCPLPDDSFREIWTAQDFELLNEDPLGNFAICQDIDFNFANPIIPSFAGILEGNGFQLSQILVSDEDLSRRSNRFEGFNGRLGLIDVLRKDYRRPDGAIVRNLALKAVTMKRSRSLVEQGNSDRIHMGSLAGSSSAGSILNVSIQGVEAFVNNLQNQPHGYRHQVNVGGVVGCSLSGTQLVKIQAHGQMRVSGQATRIGGIVGTTTECPDRFSPLDTNPISLTDVISNQSLLVSQPLSPDQRAPDYVGGLIGLAGGVNIERVKVDSEIQFEDYELCDHFLTGGLIGSAYGVQMKGVSVKSKIKIGECANRYPGTSNNSYPLAGGIAGELRGVVNLAQASVDASIEGADLTGGLAAVFGNASQTEDSIMKHILVKLAARPIQVQRARPPRIGGLFAHTYLYDYTSPAADLKLSHILIVPDFSDARAQRAIVSALVQRPWHLIASDILFDQSVSRVVSDPYSVGYSTRELTEDSSLYLDWDLENVWRFEPGNYPELR